MDKEDVAYIFNGILLSHKKNEILPFVTTGIDLESIMLSEISQRKTNAMSFHLYVKSKKQNKHNKTETDAQIQRTKR